MAERKVTMDLCIRVAGKVKCKTEGFKATYKKGTVGPTAVEITYPE